MSRSEWFKQEIDQMLEDVSKVKNKGELEEIFDRILTPREINDMGKRYAIIKMLLAGNTYGEIETKLRVSPSIVARVSSKIGYGFRRGTVEKEEVVVGNFQVRPKKRPKSYGKGAPIKKMFG